jgi:ElaB/YqjD/DUF883 family membrane-anchored ribosome-binding protein
MSLTEEKGRLIIVQNSQSIQTKSKVTNMNETQIKTGQQHDVNTLAKDARSLVTATTDVASQKFGEARQRVVEKVESAKETAGRVRDQAVECAKATDEAVRQYPYQALGIAFGVGALLGYLVSHRGSRNGD